MWWHTPVVPAPGKWKEGQEFKVTLSYVASFSLAILKKTKVTYDILGREKENLQLY